MDENNIGVRAEASRKIREANNKTEGRTNGEHTILSYTAAGEGMLAIVPSNTEHRQPLQDSQGRFLRRPLDDGTMETGLFGVDAFGRFVSI
jgi:hypothetical protein